MHGNFGVLVLGHGSTLTHNKEIIEATAAMPAKKLDGAVVKTAYLNMDTPTVEEGLTSFKDTTVDRVYGTAPVLSPWRSHIKGHSRTIGP